MALIEHLDETLSAGRIVGRSWKSLLLAFKKMPELFLSAIVVSAILIIVRIILAAKINAFALRSEFWGPLHLSIINYWLQRFLGIIASGVVATPVAIAMHRYILLGEMTRGPVSLGVKRTWLFLLWVIAVQALISVAQYTGLWLASPRSLYFDLYTQWLLSGAVFIPTITICWGALVFLALLFPAIAVDAPIYGIEQRIRASANAMKARFWKFVFAIALTCVPITLAAYLLDSYGWRPILWKANIDGTNLGALWIYSDGMTGAIITVVLAALGAAVASWTYADAVRTIGTSDSQQ